MAGSPPGSSRPAEPTTTSAAPATATGRNGSRASTRPSSIAAVVQLTVSTPSTSPAVIAG